MAAKSLCSLSGCGNPRHAKGLCRAHRIEALRSEAGPCVVAGCEHDCFSFSLRLCAKHYYRQMKRGTTELDRTEPGSTQRFIETVALPFSLGDCLSWPFSRDRDGYGKARYNGIAVKASRIVCELANGMPHFVGAEAAHSCGKSECVNPKHLYWATPKANASDRERHGTHPHGVDSPNAKLTERDVLEIRRLQGRISATELAERFGVSKTGVWNVWARRSWRHLDELP